MTKKINKILRLAIHVIEHIIATMTVAVLLALLGFEIFKMFTQEGYFLAADTFLRNMLTIVVGLEFARMLINLTPANTLEVLIVAISRHVIINHEDYIGNIACVLCIAGLFAIRKFLISRKEDKKEDTNDNINK